MSGCRDVANFCPLVLNLVVELLWACPLVVLYNMSVADVRVVEFGSYILASGVGSLSRICDRTYSKLQCAAMRFIPSQPFTICHLLRLGRLDCLLPRFSSARGFLSGSSKINMYSFCQDDLWSCPPIQHWQRHSALCSSNSQRVSNSQCKAVRTSAIQLQYKKTRKPSCRWQTRATPAKSLHRLRKSSGVVVSCIASLPIDSVPMVYYFVL